jgi:hypothetical protein
VVDEVSGARETSRRTRAVAVLAVVLLVLGVAVDRWRLDRERAALLTTVEEAESTVTASLDSLLSLADYAGPLLTNEDVPPASRRSALTTLARDAARWSRASGRDRTASRTPPSCRGTATWRRRATRTSSGSLRGTSARRRRPPRAGAAAPTRAARRTGPGPLCSPRAPTPSAPGTCSASGKPRPAPALGWHVTTVEPEGRKMLRLEVRNSQVPIEKKPSWIKTRRRWARSTPSSRRS